MNPTPVSAARHARASLFPVVACAILLTCSGRTWAAAAAPDALIHAVQRLDAAAWTTLLQQKAPVNGRDAAGNTALHFAALNHDLHAVRALLAAGAEVDPRNSAGATPLLYGAGQVGIARALLAGGADVNATSKLSVTPLMVAVLHAESYEAARVLIEAGADVRATRAPTDSLLRMAVTGGHRRTIDLLLERGAGDAANALSTALVAAAGAGETGLVRLLLERGADINYDAGFIGHALNTALFTEQLETARLLIEKGADLNLRSPRGHGTPPMVWAGYNQVGDPSIAQALVAKGVPADASNDVGATALSYALKTGAGTPLVHYLQQVGARVREPARAKRVPDRPVPATAAERAAVVKERMQPTLDVLQRSSDAFLANGFVQQAGCTSCHGQDLPPRAYALARARGFKIDDHSLGRQIAALRARWDERAENARQMQPPVPGSPVSVAYGLFGLHASGQPADDLTDAMVRYLLRTQKSDGHWNDFTRRPPMEDGSFVATGWVTLSIRDYAPAGHERVAAEAQARAARWLAQQEPVNHNELVFQLLGLHWSGEPLPRLGFYVDRVVRAQRPDGGWAQLAGLESDAWATGSTLFALHEIGAMRTTDEVYQRGVAFLLRTQFEDGSWWVRSRSWPFQPHFNGQFPHGKDQWISQGATAWAAIALLLTLEPMDNPPLAPKAPELLAAFTKANAGERKKPVAAAMAPTAAAIEFTRNIQPLLERSCAGCHGGEKPKAGFTVASRDLLLKGGASGEPAIMPGDADESPLLQYVSGKIEDLEMPPLDRRDKYPALTPAEIELLRTWIEAGAPAGRSTAGVTR